MADNRVRLLALRKANFKKLTSQETNDYNRVSEAITLRGSLPTPDQIIFDALEAKLLDDNPASNLGKPERDEAVPVAVTAPLPEKTLPVPGTPPHVKTTKESAADEKADEKAKHEADARKREAAEAREKEDAKAKHEADAKAKTDAEAKAKADADAKAKAVADAKTPATPSSPFATPGSPGSMHQGGSGFLHEGGEGGSMTPSSERHRDEEFE